MSGLAYDIVARRGAETEPARYMLFLHGILGTRANWRGLARKFVEQDSDEPWGAVLVDLREHGDSLGLAGPSTVAQASADLVALRERLPAPITGVLGHSFGGKVAMQHAIDRSHHDPLEVLYVVDSAPGAVVDPDADARSSYTQDVIALLRSLPFPMPDRDAFIDAVVAAGHARGVAMWLAMNLKRTESGERTLMLDLDKITALLDSYFATDTWAALESGPDETRVEVILGGRSEVYDAAARSRAQAASTARDNVSLHVIEEAGHWVHVDAPDALAALLR